MVSQQREKMSKSRGTWVTRTTQPRFGRGLLSAHTSCSLGAFDHRFPGTSRARAAAAVSRPRLDAAGEGAGEARRTPSRAAVHAASKGGRGLRANEVQHRHCGMMSARQRLLPPRTARRTSSIRALLLGRSPRTSARRSTSPARRRATTRPGRIDESALVEGHGWKRIRSTQGRDGCARRFADAKAVEAAALACADIQPFIEGRSERRSSSFATSSTSSLPNGRKRLNARRRGEIRAADCLEIPSPERT
jgi:hypothetical protein